MSSILNTTVLPGMPPNLNSGEKSMEKIKRTKAKLVFTKETKKKIKAKIISRNLNSIPNDEKLATEKAIGKNHKKEASAFLP